MKRLPALVFDLDGTLVDSVADVRLALNRTLVGAGILASLAEVRSWIGEGARALLAKALRAHGHEFDDARLDALTAAFTEIYEREPVVETQAFPQACEALTELAARGHPIGVCTNKPEAVSRQVLQRCGFTPLVQSLVGGGRGFAPKPCPDALRRCLADLGRGNAEAIFVGDSHIDLETARAAQCRVVLVTYGYSNSPIDEMGADAVIDSLAGLGDAVHRLGTPIQARASRYAMPE